MMFSRHAFAAETKDEAERWMKKISERCNELVLASINSSDTQSESDSDSLFSEAVCIQTSFIPFSDTHGCDSAWVVVQVRKCGGWLPPVVVRIVVIRVCTGALRGSG